ncbi:MAG TPA: helix-turn-helix domain-containing protein [Spirochaetia bacterium]|nr:helix-turn-helix domain-containing protein [Spirochaetia bacterium]
MDLRLGYYPVLDAALGLRQLHEGLRFAPFGPAMETLRERLASEAAAIEAVGAASDGWLGVLESLLAPESAGLAGAEEGLVRLESDADAAGALVAKALRAVVAPEAARRSRALVASVEAIGRGLAAAGPWDYLAGLSDRLRRAGPGELLYKIKPAFRFREEEVERLVVTPSLLATRRLTFWRREGTFLFFVGGEGEPEADEAPDGVLLGALALADRTRLRMLRRLSASPCGNAEMADFLGVNPSTASRHFKLFKDAGLVELRGAEGARLEYELAPEGLDAALRAIAEYVQGGRT